MRRWALLLIAAEAVFVFASGFRDANEYQHLYLTSLHELGAQQDSLLATIAGAPLDSPAGIAQVKHRIALARLRLKDADFWMRYLEPIAYDRINGPLRVEWENEVFEKYEKPYRREGGGLSLAELALDDSVVSRDTLLMLVRASIAALPTFEADSITRQLEHHPHLYLANRLFLLNLAAVYTTGFECPDFANIVPELRSMLAGVGRIYDAYDASFPTTPLPRDYRELYAKMVAFVAGQPDDFAAFDHFTFIRDYVNPLFAINQRLIRDDGAGPRNTNDYALNDDCTSIFSKRLYLAQNTKGVYSLVQDPKALAEIRRIGRLLFYDPLLSANNQRSCASCHDPSQCFTDTTVRTALQLDRRGRLPRNAPSLADVTLNHLIMLDGLRTTLPDQAHAVITNPIELGGDEKAILGKVMSCSEYRKAFTRFQKLVPEQRRITMEHVISAITLYYGAFSEADAPFDDAINARASLGDDAHRGFNLFMSKAQCGTCHFVPHFNGIKPPYISSEFEVLGVPEDSSYSRISDDVGRYGVNPAPETLHAFRTVTVRNAERTPPYMHNGVFATLKDVIDFYDAGGGTGKGLKLTNQTLTTDSLKLSIAERGDLTAFIHTLNERFVVEPPPASLPASDDPALNHRKVGGDY